MPAKAPKQVSGWPTLIAEGNAWIIGLPSGFSLADSLHRAREVRLATAFARRSGWKYFHEAASKGTASYALLTGLDCWHTQPELLKDWHELTMKWPDRIESKVALKEIFFHPKVLIVTSDGKQPHFAVVGSGNLSQGGLCDNVECGVYVEDRGLIAQLTDWFDKQFERAKRLTDEGIAAYAGLYKSNIKGRSRLEEKQKAVQTIMDGYAEARMGEWDRAVREAKAFFSKYGTDRQRKAHAKAEELRNALNWYADFSFDRGGLDDFFANRFLGHLREGQKPKVWKHQQRFKTALRAVLDCYPSATIPQSVRGKVRRRYRNPNLHENVA
jgi:HKD family nuclease